MTHLTRELHAAINLFTDMDFVETPDALLSQFLARKPVCRFIIPHLSNELRKAMFASLYSTGRTVTIFPHSLIHDGARIKYTKVEIRP